jgi:hypothetical protein
LELGSQARAWLQTDRSLPPGLALVLSLLVLRGQDPQTDCQHLERPEPEWPVLEWPVLEWPVLEWRVLDHQTDCHWLRQVPLA